MACGTVESLIRHLFSFVSSEVETPSSCALTMGISTSLDVNGSLAVFRD